MNKRSFFLAMASLVVPAILSARVALPTHFTSNMVLQQQSSLLIKGQARPNSTVDVQTSWSRTPVSVMADGQGRFEMRIATPKASLKPHTLTFSDGEETTLENVLIGEVWLGSGQSNMEMPVEGWGKVFNYEEEIANANYPMIRLLQVKKKTSISPLEQVELNMGGWQECSPQFIPNFSALCYFYALRLWEELKVPIGVIDDDWGGTVAEAWVSAESLEQVNGFESQIGKYRELGFNRGAIEEYYVQQAADFEANLRRMDKGFCGPTPWTALELDDDGWKAVPVPGIWEDVLGSIDGIVANSEYAMCDAAYIADQLGLVGNPENAVATLSSKSSFRTLQKKEGLFAPKFLADTSIDQVLSNKELLSYPIIIKPDESSGTRSVVTITDSCDHDRIRKAINEARTVSRNGRAIAEEFVSMPDRTVIEGEIFLHHGEILWDGLFNTVRSQNMLMIPMTYVFPLHEEERRKCRLKESLAKAFHAAGIIHGEYNIEMVFTEDDEPFLIEINPRQGGNDLPRYVQESSGIDFTRLLVTTAMGDDYYWNSQRCAQRKSEHIVHHMLYPHIGGIFEGLRIDDSISPCIRRIQIDPAVGEKIEEAHDGSYDIGCVDLCIDDAEEQMRVAMQIEELIQICIR